MISSELLRIITSFFFLFFAKAASETPSLPATVLSRSDCDWVVYRYGYGTHRRVN